MMSGQNQVEDLIIRVGKGPRLLILHGGPGFDHVYLAEALQWLTPDYELIYYDQVGCGTTPSIEGGVRLPDMGDQLVRVVEHLGASGQFGVVAHSWGSLVLATAAAQPQNKALFETATRGGILINPLPLTRAGYDAAYAAFVARIPPERAAAAQSVALQTGDGSRVMDVLWPYYFADAQHAVRLKPVRFPLDLATYTSATTGLDNFDMHAALPLLSKYHIVRGAEDFTKSELLAALATTVKSVNDVEGAGHFPMLENPEAWKRQLARLLSDI